MNLKCDIRVSHQSLRTKVKVRSKVKVKPKNKKGGGGYFVFDSEINEIQRGITARRARWTLLGSID